MYCECALQQISTAPWIRSVSPCYRWLGSQDMELVWSHTQPRSEKDCFQDQCSYLLTSLGCYLLLFFNFYYTEWLTIDCACAHMHAPVYLWRFKNSVGQLVLFFHCVDPGIRTQVIRLGSKWASLPALPLTFKQFFFLILYSFISAILLLRLLVILV